MALTDTFKCSKLHTTITVSRCLRNQKEALEFWGAEAVKFNSCPCEKGEELKGGDGDMPRERGTCENCNREDMAVQRRGGKLLCASCGGATTGLNPSAAALALAEKKKKYEGKGKMRGPKPSELPVSKYAATQRYNQNLLQEIKPAKDGDIIENLIEKYNLSIDQAEEIIGLLVSLKKYGAEFEMPARHILRHN